MKMLFCTNAFQHITNGPAKFAHLLLKISDFYPDCEIKILTEDIYEQTEQVYKIKLSIPTFINKASQFFRMYQYHKKAMKIYNEDFQFDVLIYNHAVIGNYSASKFKNTVGFINDDNVLRSPFLKGLLNLSLKNYHFFHVFEKSAAKKMKAIITNSEYMKNALQQKYHLPVSKLYVVNKGIEFEPELGSDKQFTKNEIKILFVKNDYKRGGLFVLIDALKLLNKKFFLTIIGPYFSEKEKIANAINDSLIQIHFLGPQTQQVVYEKMKNADIFCVPSLREAYGVSNIEAMALGCAVVSSDAGGIPEVLEDGACGWISKAGDSISLSQAIDDCIHQDELRLRKIKQGFIKAKSLTLKPVLEKFYHTINTIHNA